MAADDTVPPGRSYATTTFNVEAGLPSNVSQPPLQTRDGYLWVGTEGGLSRFDGVHFKTYRRSNEPALADNLVRVVFEDQDGWLWIGTQHGLSRMRDGKFERVGGFRNAITDITQDASGRIWIGTLGAGLREYRDGTLQQRAGGPLLTVTDSVTDLFVDHEGRLWIARLAGGIVCLENGVFSIPPWARTGFGGVNKFAEAPAGTMWFGTTHGLFRERAGEVQRFGQAQGIGDEAITDVHLDHAGRLWVASRRLWVTENPERDAFTLVPVPQVEYCRSIIQDREGSYWIGTSGDGVARMRPSAFRMVVDADQNPLVRVRSVAVDPQGIVWAGAGVDPRGLARIAPDGLVTFVPLGEGADAEIMSVFATRDGGIWIGTRGALALWHDGKLQRFPAYRNVRAIFEDRSSTIWFGLVNAGVVRYHEGSFAPLAGMDELARAQPTTFAQDEQGAVYVGYFAQGIVKIEAGRLTRIGLAQGLPAEEVRAIHPDKEGRLWVGLRTRGLAVMIDGRWYNPKELVEPFADRVLAVDEDNEGNLWLGTQRGIVWGRKRDFLAVARGESAEGKFRVAGATDGVHSGPVGTGSQPTWSKAADGTLWFAGHDGLVAVKPALITVNAVAPPVWIENATVDGRVTAHGAELRLEAGVRSLSIDYTGLSFVEPARVQFRYQLVGYDRDWVQAGSRRSAFYTNLSPGHYEFRVMASNEDGVWNETGASLPLVQLPWFYQTWWFYLTVALALAGIVMLMYLWRTADLRRIVRRQTEQIRLQVEEEEHLRAELERTTRLESLGVLAGGIAHDFNNLLTVVIANISLARLDDRVRAAAGGMLDDAERGAKRAADLTQQLLTFAKGGDPLRTAVALPEIVREAADFARHGSTVRCEISVADDLPPANVDRGQISRVVHNLVLNAAQAMPQGGVIRLALTAQTVRAGEVPTLPAGPHVKLSVADAGPGIAPEHLARIFDPYFSTKPGNSGLGLATVHSIVKKHLGYIDVESQPGRGTTFHVWLPAAAVDAPKPAAPVAAERVNAHGARVLFMDDEEIIRRAAELVLERFGHEPTTVSDGEAAVREYESARAAGRPYDVVILDLTVPAGMGGKATMEALRRIDPGVKAIVSSGYSSDPVMANYRDYGFRAAVPKPYEAAALAKAIREVIGN